MHINTSYCRIFAGFLCLAICFACSKTASPPVIHTFSYGDTVFYINGDNNQRIKPVTDVQGTFTGFPLGLDINPQSGEINLATSETGLKYLVSFVPDNSTDTLYSFITVSGINYADGFYHLNTDDSIVRPLYNTVAVSEVPGIGGGGTKFDLAGGCNDNGCNVIPATGSINIAQTVRNKVFGKNPENGLNKEFDLEYKVDDKSGKSKDKLRIRLFYFTSMADVTQEAKDIIASRQGTFLSASSNAIPAASVRLKAGKPRPPCIFIVGR